MLRKEQRKEGRKWQRKKEESNKGREGVKNKARNVPTSPILFA
jgi:hypothetical protein